MSIAKIAAKKNGIQPLEDSEISVMGGGCALPMGGLWTTEAYETGPVGGATSTSFNGSNVDTDIVWDPCEGHEPLIV